MLIISNKPLKKYLLVDCVLSEQSMFCGYSRCSKNSCFCIKILLKISSKPQQKPAKLGSSPPEVFCNKKVLKIW